MAVILTGKPFGSELRVELMPVPLGSSRKPWCTRTVRFDCFCPVKRITFLNQPQRKDSDMADKMGRAVKRKTADVKGRAMKKGK